MVGWNTVAVIYNDHLRLGGRSIDRMDDAVLHASLGRRATEAGLGFGFGKVISTAHADYDQVVVVGQNTGRLADDMETLSWFAVDQMKRALERNGYRVTKSRKRSVQS